MAVIEDTVDKKNREQGLWVIVSYAQMFGLRPWRLAEISDFSERWKVPTIGTNLHYIQHMTRVYRYWTVVNIRESEYNGPHAEKASTESIDSSDSVSDSESCPTQ